MWPDNAEDGGREGDKQGGHRGCYRHQANCIRAEDHQQPASPDRRDEITRKMGNGGLDAVHLYARSMHRCYPAHAHAHTPSTGYKQIGETTTGEDKCTKHIPHVNKPHDAQQCVPRSCHQLSPLPRLVPGASGSRRQRKEEDEEEQLGYAASDLLPCAVICCFNPSLVPRSVF